jgi:PAS domain S-box-containing protein
MHHLSPIRRRIMLLFFAANGLTVTVLAVLTPLVAGYTLQTARTERLYYAILGPIVLAGVLAALYRYLRPISDLGYALEIGSTPDPELARDARRIALNAPIYFFVLMAGGAFLLAILLNVLGIFWMPGYDLHKQFAAFLLIAATSLCGALVISLVSRQWMRPVLLYTAAQAPAGGYRLNIRMRLFAVVTAVAAIAVLVTWLASYTLHSSLLPPAVSAVAALGISALAMLAVALVASHHLAAGLTAGLRDVTDRLLDIAQDERIDLGPPLPALSLDEVGDLIMAYNALQQRISGQQEQMESRQRQLTALQSLSYKIGTARDMDHLLHEVIRDVERAFGYHNAAILLVDREEQELWTAATDHFDPTMHGRRFKIGEEGVVGRVAATGTPLLINDVSRCDFHIPDQTNARSEIAVPLTIADRAMGDSTIGVLFVSSERTGAFNESDLHMLSALGNQIATVIENARLFEEVTAKASELEGRTRNLTALHDISAALSGSLRVEEVLGIAMRHLVSLFEVEHSTAILLGTDEQEGRIVAEHPRLGMAEQRIATRDFPALEWVLSTHYPLPIADVPHSEIIAPIRQQLARLNVQSLLMVPLFSKGAIQGVLTLDSVGHSRRFTPEEEGICQTIAAQVAVAVENVRLVRDLNLQADLLARMGRDVAAERSRLDAVLRSLADGLLVTDPGGRIVLFNRAFLSLFNLQDDGLRGKLVGEVLPEVSWHGLILQTSGADVARVQEFSTPDGKFVQATATLVHESDQVAGVVMILRDVTDEKRIERMKSDFISTVSHEFRTPLTPVLGFAKLVRRSFDKHIMPLLPPAPHSVQQTAGRIDHNLDILIGEVERLSRLVEDVLFLADLDADRLTWHMQEVDLGTVAQERVEAFLSEAQAKDLDLRAELPASLSPVHADGERLARVIDNLVSNAIKFTKTGEVRVRLQELHLADGDWTPPPLVDVPMPVPGGVYLMVAVSDTGSGISAQAQPTLFERFGQGTYDVLIDKPSGTGLGLAISKEIVSRHGGHIWADSEPGQGSTFAFLLPVVPPRAGRVLPGQEGAPGTGAPLILVVEDDAEMRGLLYHILFGAGYRALLAADGPTALNMARTHRPDLILLDVMIPGITGLDVTSVLKADDTTREIPIVILSAMADPTKATRLGADAYLVKPSGTEVILDAIGRLLETAPRPSGSPEVN